MKNYLKKCNGRFYKYADFTPRKTDPTEIILQNTISNFFKWSGYSEDFTLFYNILKLQPAKIQNKLIGKLTATFMQFTHIKYIFMCN